MVSINLPARHCSSVSYSLHLICFIRLPKQIVLAEMPLVYIFFKFLKRLNQPFSKGPFCLLLLLRLFRRLWFPLLSRFSFHSAGFHLVHVLLPFLLSFSFFLLISLWIPLLQYWSWCEWQTCALPANWLLLCPLASGLASSAEGSSPPDRNRGQTHKALHTATPALASHSPESLPLFLPFFLPSFLFLSFHFFLPVVFLPNINNSDVYVIVIPLTVYVASQTNVQLNPQACGPAGPNQAAHEMYTVIPIPSPSLGWLFSWHNSKITFLKNNNDNSECSLSHLT